MVNILIVDDEPEILRFVGAYFKKIEGYMVLPATNASEAMAQLYLKPDIILLDIMMPQMDGYTLCSTIREQLDCPILFLTAKSDEADKLMGFAAGADDYIVKPFGIRELHARIEAHLRRERRRSGSRSIDYGGVWINPQAKQASINDIVVPLTRKEFEILALLCQNSGNVFSREQIYEKIWGYDAMGDAQTAITEHIKRIRKKIQQLGASHISKKIKTVWGIGYRWEG